MRRLLLMAGALLCAASSQAAQESSRVPSNPPAPSVEAITPVALDGDTVTAMQAEIDARIQAGQKAARELQQKTLAATGAQRLELMKKSQALSESVYLDILRIQARHTRAAGFVAAAQRIEAVVEARIEARENPASRVAVQKVERQHPVEQGGQR